MRARMHCVAAAFKLQRWHGTDSGVSVHRVVSISKLPQGGERDAEYTPGFWVAQENFSSVF